MRVITRDHESTYYHDSNHGFVENKHIMFCLFEIHKKCDIPQVLQEKNGAKSSTQEVKTEGQKLDTKYATWALEMGRCPSARSGCGVALVVDDEFRDKKLPFHDIYIYWLVVWLPFFIFPYIGNFIIPIDFHIFQRGG